MTKQKRKTNNKVWGIHYHETLWPVLKYTHFAKKKTYIHALWFNLKSEICLFRCLLYKMTAAAATIAGVVRVGMQVEETTSGFS